MLSIINKNKIANKLFKLRKELKLKQSELAVLANINKEIIENIEIGEYDGDVKVILYKICSATDTEIEYFFPKPKIKPKTEGQKLAKALYIRWDFEETLKPLSDFMGRMFDEGFMTKEGEMTDKANEICLKLIKPYIKKLIEENEKEKEEFKNYIHKQAEQYKENRKLINPEFLNKKFDDSLLKKILKDFPLISG